MNAPLRSNGVMSIATPSDAKAERRALERRMLLREAYDRVEPREGLCQFDAKWMNVLEGRA